MENKKKPKYIIGDTVVITIYGTVGKVTNVNLLFLFDGECVIISIHNTWGDGKWQWRQFI